MRTAATGISPTGYSASKTDRSTGKASSGTNSQTSNCSARPARRRGLP
jgi:hypothetical protein